MNAQSPTEDRIEDAAWVPALLTPKRVAIVGATGKPGSVYSRPVAFMEQHGFRGEIELVNPKYERIGERRCLPSLSDIEGEIDLVFIMVPASMVEGVVEECGRLGVKAAIVYSSGFAETGADGEQLQDRMVAAARRGGVRLLGPNCQGVIHQPSGLVATWSAGIGPGLPPASGLAYVGQSGAIGGGVLDLARELGTGLTTWVSVGNQADLTLSEVGLALIERDDVSVLACYIESLDDGERFTALTRRAAQLGKRLVILRSGRTNVGRKAAVSHTGALLAPGESLDAVARRDGAETVHDTDDLLTVSATLLRSPRPAGKRVAVLTSSGGAGSLAADALIEAGLEIPTLDRKLQARLAEFIPDYGATANPVDVTAHLFADGGTDFVDVARLLVGSEQVDQLVMVLTTIVGEYAERLAKAIAELAADTDKPLHFGWIVGREQTADARAAFREAGIPIFSSVVALARCARAVATQPRRIERERRPDRGAEARFHAAGGNPEEALDAAGVPRPGSILLDSPESAAEAVKRVGGRAVLKAQSAWIAHKTEFGLVRLAVRPADAERVAAAIFAGMGDSAGRVLVQEQLEPGLELLVGVVRERTDFPPLLTVGMGGVTAEAMADVVTEALPVDEATVNEMLERLRASSLFKGFRGGPAYDVGAAVDAIVRIARAAELIGPALRELEVNPLIVAPQGGGAAAVDVVINLDSAS